MPTRAGKGTGRRVIKILNRGDTMRRIERKRERERERERARGEEGEVESQVLTYVSTSTS